MIIFYLKQSGRILVVEFVLRKLLLNINNWYNYYSCSCNIHKEQRNRKNINIFGFGTRIYKFYEIK